MQSFKKVNSFMSFTEWIKLRWYQRSEKYISKKMTRDEMEGKQSKLDMTKELDPTFTPFIWNSKSMRLISALKPFTDRYQETKLFC